MIKVQGRPVRAKHDALMRHGQNRGSKEDVNFAEINGGNV